MKHTHTRRWFLLTAHDDPDPTPEPDPRPDQDPAPDPSPDPDPDPDSKTFTQDEVNRIVKQRAERMLRQQLGDDADLDSLTDLATKAREYDELKASEQSDLEREQAARERAEAERDTERQRAREIVLENEILKIAGQQEISDPVAAYKLLDRELIEYEDGRPTNIGELLGELKEAHPFLKGAPAGKVGGSADGGGKGDPAPKDFRTADRSDFAAELSKYGLRTRT